ncbi:hypothetical protein [Nitriliruptor alkaliphilus]|uniref:hypothetical protein n=1 Tax=Nitriliruptor alkaliphilus TaxID=427918 RepID=UPI000698B8D9|nr:hypothetical protein [Nitriliruptor alkaliphilus]
MSEPEAAAPDAALPRDPFAPIDASPRGRTVLVVLAVLCAVAAAIAGVAPLAGPLGMILGLVAHVKGSRFGMPATVLAAIGTVLGFTVTFLLR